MCIKNKQDVDEIEARYLKGLKIHYVDTMKAVLDLALTKEKVKDPISIAAK
jgi:ATP-dependent Lon protease